MSAQAIQAETGQDQEATPSATKGRWGVDLIGSMVYYPFGPAFQGYRATDAAAEVRIRAADEHYDQSSKLALPVSGALAAGLLYLLGLLFDRHPVLAVTFFYAAIIMIVGIIAALRFKVVRASLAGLATAPAEVVSRQRLIKTLGMAVSTIVVFWLVLYLYDLRLDALAADHPKEMRFYPTVAGNMIYAAVGLPFLFAAIVHFDKLAARAGQNRTTFALLLFAMFQLGALAIIVFKFIDPKPSIAISERSLVCGWRHDWREMTGVDLSDGRKGKEYAVVKLQPPVVRALGISSDRCRIDGLSVDYEDVYRTIVSAWQPHANDP
ncbi:hypothetical protein [Afipia sp. GAS231]|uniref:hypothetical protein n=1 Tax=Afipia sp. GAS231 TaxID=1882747 RepID=UPI00087C1DBB|nr:hypothetical protein [Afipia sp. GAS231]SDM90015.1 hypothetical protein SAMN05444050_0135 [Afipia sp. GAS231]